MDFPKNRTRAPFGPSAYFEANFRVFSSKQQQFRRQTLEATPTQTLCSSSTAQNLRRNYQRSTQLRQAAWCITNPKQSTYVCNTTSNVGGGQRHPALVERHASTNYYLKRSPRLFLRIEHAQHITHHKIKTTQHNTRTSSIATANPTTAQLADGKRPRDSSLSRCARSCSVVLRL